MSTALELAVKRMARLDGEGPTKAFCDVAIAGAYLVKGIKVVHGKNGTGRLSRVNGVTSAGKTGTSQNPHGEDHAWFIGYSPAVDPEIAIAVVIENGGHGGAVAAPIARDLYILYYKIRSAEAVVSRRPPEADKGEEEVGE